MDKKEFKGNLEKIFPEKIINENSPSEIQNFFLILGMIFNDLKGLIFFQKIIEDTYRKPLPDEVSVQMGEYNGLMTQANKYLISTVSEFLTFLEKNKSVTTSISFGALLKKLDKEKQKSWNELINLNRDGTSVLSKMARVRSNIAFHYDHSTTELRRGFSRSFFTEGKDLIQHRSAYFSLGDNMELTRIYYSDAAVEEYMKSIISGEEMGNIQTVIESMNMSIQSLLKAYIRSIKKS